MRRADKVTIFMAFLCLLLPAQLTAPLTQPAWARGVDREKPILAIQDISSDATGFQAWLVEDHSVPVVSVSFSFDGGLAFDPADKPGTGHFLSVMLDEGAGELDSAAFQKKLADHAISLSFSAGRDDFTGSLKTLTENRDVAFGLLQMALTRPRFDDDALARMREALLSNVRHNLKDPDWLAARSFNGLVFEGHRYALPGQGTLLSLASITREDLLAFSQKQFTRDKLRVAIAGDISATEAAALLEKAFGALPASGPAALNSAAELRYAGKTILLPYDVPQTVIMMAQDGIAPSDPRWFQATMLNHILGGGGFGSRLMEEVRVKRGLTYGIGTSLVTMDGAALLQLSASTVNGRVGETLAVIRKEWENMAGNGVSRKELNDAREYLTGSLALQLTSTGQIAAIMNGLQRDDLGIDYLDQRDRAIRAVSAGELKTLAGDWLKTQTLTTILVGKPEGVSPDFTLQKAPGTE